MKQRYTYIGNPKNAILTKEGYHNLLTGLQGTSVSITILAQPLFVDFATSYSSPLISIGSQTLCVTPGGGTGSIDPIALRNLSATCAMIGHSDERRAGRTLKDLLEIIPSVPEELVLIVCLGEQEYAQSSQLQMYRELHELAEVVNSRKGTTYIAYEPWWLISTNKSDAQTLAQSEIVIHCKKTIEQIKEVVRGKQILYGGSVQDFTQTQLHQLGADGFLVGSLSKDSQKFLSFINQLES